MFKVHIVYNWKMSQYLAVLFLVLFMRLSPLNYRNICFTPNNFNLLLHIKNREIIIIKILNKNKKTF
jgi:hypothetical protein